MARSRFEERSWVLADPDSSGHDLVVERRHDNLDAFVHDDPQIPEDVLLRDERPGGTPDGCFRQAVDERVDAGSGQSRGGTAAEHLLPCQASAQAAVGSMSWSPRTMRSRFAATFS